jgi:hypothetical protein
MYKIYMIDNHLFIEGAELVKRGHCARRRGVCTHKQGFKNLKEVFAHTKWFLKTQKGCLEK